MNNRDLYAAARFTRPEPTYRVKPVVCPRCHKVMEVEKPKNRGSIHMHRMRVLAKHSNEECKP